MVFFCLRLKQFFGRPLLQLENTLQTFLTTAVFIRALYMRVGLITLL